MFLWPVAVRIEISGSHDYSGGRRCPGFWSVVDKGWGAERRPPILFFFCAYTQLSGYFSSLPDKEKRLGLCFGCHRELFYMSDSSGCFFFLLERQGRFYICFCMLCLCFSYQDDFDKETLMRWL